ncbi:MAG: chromosomal replication initiator protein DnaA [Actinomycetota bacterium]|nr:chromosomal replication initiator protein DnaA [Actinomycetota bacterium]
MREQLDSIWDCVRGELRREVPDFKFHIWLEPLELAGVEGRTLYVKAPDHIRTWVRDRYLPLLAAASARAFRADALVEVVDGAWTPDPGKPDAPFAPAPGANELRLRPKYTFEQFVIGRGNRFAHAAALAVAEQPGQTYNPLFIYGRPGLGKTHLLHAVGNYVTRFAPALTVRYATVEEFTTEFVQAVRAKDTDAFKRSFRGVDVLLLDDVQFLADKTRTEEELFHTFNVLHDSGRQLVMTSDRSPEQLGGIEDRLGERFASGLVVGLEPPDLPVRRAILEKRARLDSVPAGPELVEEIAVRVTTSVRALEAALIQVVAYASLRNELPSPELARRLLERLAPEQSQGSCTVAAILDATATQFGIGTDSLLARDRRPAVARARKVAMYLARELTGQSFPEIGRGFGDRDHSTVLHAVRSVSTEVTRDPELATAVNNLRTRLSR